MGKSSGAIKDRLQIISALRQLQPGSLLDIQFDTHSKVRLKCKLMGVDEPQYLAITIPAAANHGYADALVEGKGTVVRSILGGESGQGLAFRSSIISIIKKPYHLMFLAYPKEIELLSLRKEQRLSTHIPAYLSASANNENTENVTQLTGIIQDISSSGCRLKAKWPLSAGKIKLVPINLTVEFPGNQTAITIKAELKNQTRSDPLHVSLGIKFEQQSPSLTALFNQLGIPHAS